MPEQLFNLYSTTLAAPYVAGSGSITVTSPGSYTKGTFSLTILDAGTGLVLLNFRVASVAGSVFTGQSEGRDGTLGANDVNAPSGSIVVGSMLTVDAVEELFADHGAMLMYSAAISATLLNGGTQFIPVAGGAAGFASELAQNFPSPTSFTAQNLVVAFALPAGAGNSVTITLRKNGVSTALTVTIAGATAVSASDTTHQVLVDAGDIIDYEIDSTGTFTGAEVVTIQTSINTGGASSGGGGGGSGAGFIQTLTPPVLADFTQVNFNTGGCTSTAVQNSTPVSSVNLTQIDPSNSLEIAGLTKAPINALFTVTVGFTIAGFSNPAAPSIIGGLWLTDGSANNIAFVLNSGNALEASVYSSFSGAFVANIFAAGIAPFPLGPMVWLRVQETSTLRIWSVSPDGINFVVIATSAVGGFFATAQYGVMVEGRNNIAGSQAVAMGWYSFAESTP